MTRLIIADCHLGQVAGDATAMGRLLGHARSADVAQVIYLGDVFQYLIGMSKFWTATVSEVLAQWRELRGAGIGIAIVEGNRDFFLDEPELRREVDWTGMMLRFASNGRRFMLVHGDRVNRRDLQYRFWAAVSKSKLARGWARLLPRRLAVEIVERMERRLATTNRRFRYLIPEPELRRTAKAAWDEGTDVVLWGHFHERWEYRRGSSRAMVLPPWLDRRLAVLVDDEGLIHFVDDTLTTVEAETAPGGVIESVGAPVAGREGG